MVMKLVLKWIANTRRARMENTTSRMLRGRFLWDRYRIALTISKRLSVVFSGHLARRQSLFSNLLTSFEKRHFCNGIATNRGCDGIGVRFLEGGGVRVKKNPILIVTFYRFVAFTSL